MNIYLFCYIQRRRERGSCGNGCEKKKGAEKRKTGKKSIIKKKNLEY